MLPIMSGDVRTPRFVLFGLHYFDFSKRKIGFFCSMLYIPKGIFQKGIMLCEQECLNSSLDWLLFPDLGYHIFSAFGGGKKEFFKASVIQNLLILPIYVKHLPEEGKMIESKGRKKSKTERRMEVGRERGKNSFPACS